MLTEQNKILLKSLADNQALLDVLRKLLEEQFDILIPTSDLGMNDLELGQATRARLVGLRKIEEAFKLITLCKSSSPVRGMGCNPAR